MPLPSSNSSLESRVVVITGATGGLGRVLALACADAGATVRVAWPRTTQARSSLRRNVARGNPEPSILPLDLGKANAEDFANVAAALQTQHGRADAIIHTAVMLGTLGPIEHQAFDQWLATLRVDLLALLV